MANYDKSTGNNGTLRMDITYTQSVANNQTTFTVKYYLINTNSATYFTSVGWSGNTAGTARSGSVSMSGSGTKTLGSWTVTKTHNADGTLSTAARTFSISLSATGTSGVGGPTSNSVTLTIPNIARKSIFGASSYSVTIDGTNTLAVGVTRYSTSFTHKVKYTLGTRNYTTASFNTSVSYAIPAAWIDQIPSAASRSGTLTLYTYSGTTLIGSVTKSFTASVPASVLPSITSVTITDVGEVPSGWSKWVQSKSTARVTANGVSAGTGATVSSVSVKVGNWTKTGNPVDFPLSGSGDMEFVATVTDSRGRKATKSITITVLEYEPPVIDNSLIVRGLWNKVPNDDGTYGLYQIDYSIYSLGGSNADNATIQWREVGTTTWSAARNVINGVIDVFGGGGISTDKTYDILVTASDSFGSATYTTILNTAFTTMDFLYGGKGVALGKVAEEEDLFEVAFRTRLRKMLSVMEGMDVSGESTFNGATTFNDESNFNNSVNFGGLVNFNRSLPSFRTQFGVTAITATSWGDFGADHVIVLDEPTWYRITLQAWISIANASGELRVSVKVAGASSYTPTVHGWGGTMRAQNVGGTSASIFREFLLQPGENIVSPVAYKIGTNATTVNYHSFYSSPMYPGGMNI